MLLYCLLLSLGIVLADIGRCRYGEEYSDCNVGCDPYCNRSNGTIMRPTCSKQCRSGCICKPGYVREHSKSGIVFCVPESQCKSCHANEHYDICTHHCQKNCGNKDEPLMCAMICIPGCICNTGYIRKEDNNSPCIPIEECEK